MLQRSATKEFLTAYREKLQRFSAGVRYVIFPAGTYLTWVGIRSIQPPVGRCYVTRLTLH